MSKRFPRTSRRRDPAAERQERESFLLLLHVFNLTAGDEAAVLSEVALERDLASDAATVQRSIDHLSGCGYLSWRPDGGLAITRAGAEYVMRRAGERHSVRDAAPPPGAAGLQRWGMGLGGPEGA